MGQQDFGDDTSPVHVTDLVAHMRAGDAPLPQILNALPIALAISLFLWTLGFLAAGLEAYFG